MVLRRPGTPASTPRMLAPDDREGRCRGSWRWTPRRVRVLAMNVDCAGLPLDIVGPFGLRYRLGRPLLPARRADILDHVE